MLTVTIGIECLERLPSLSQVLIMLEFRHNPLLKNGYTKRKARPDTISVERCFWARWWSGKMSTWLLSNRNIILPGVSYQARITDQLRRLGGSCDWDRVAFTMSPVGVILSISYISNRLLSSRYQKPLLRRFVGSMRMASSTAPIDLLTGAFSWILPSQTLRWVKESIRWQLTQVVLHRWTKNNSLAVPYLTSQATTRRKNSSLVSLPHLHITSKDQVCSNWDLCRRFLIFINRWADYRRYDPPGNNAWWYSYCSTSRWWSIQGNIHDR